MDSPNHKDLQPLYEAANQNLGALQALLYEFHGLQFDGKKCLNNTSVTISQRRNGAGFIVREFGGNGKLSYLKGLDFRGVLGAHTTDVTACAQYLQRFAGVTADAPTVSGSPKPQPKKNNAKAGVIVDSWGSEIGQLCAKHLAAKTGADVAFLSRYDATPIQKVTYHSGAAFTHGTGAAAYGFAVADWYKIRQIAGLKDGDKGHRILRGSQPYCFGLAQLPPTGETLFICAGETDTICANRWGNGSGIYAVTFGSESGGEIDENILSDLQGRFKNILLFFDADGAGIKSAEEKAERHGLTYCDTKHFINYFGTANAKISRCKDICGFYGAAGGEITTYFLEVARDGNTQILADKNDLFSLGIKHALKLPFGQYLDDIDYIGTALLQYKRVTLQSPAGTGKSSLLKSLIPNLITDKNSFFIQQRGRAFDRIIITAPTRPLAAQLHKDFTANGLPNCQLIDGDLSGNLLRHAQDGQTIIVTYDSVLKAADFTDNSFLIVDEMHQLITEKGYRYEATNSVMRFIADAPYCLLLSATPNYLLSRHLGAKLIVGEPEITNNIHLTLYDFTGKEKDIIPFVISEFLAQKSAGKIAKNATLLLKADDSGLLRAGAVYAQSLGLTTEIFTSKDEKYKSNNANYNSILDSSKYATPIDIIFTTCLIEAGVSIKENMPIIAMLDTYNAAKIIQQYSRARYQPETGINENIQVLVFFKSKPRNSPNRKKADVLFAEKVSLGQAAADSRNGLASGEIDEKISIDGSTYCYYELQKDDSKIYKVDTLKAIYDVETLSVSECPLPIIISRIKQLDGKRVASAKIQQIDIPVNCEMREADAEIKGEKETAKAKFINFISAYAANNTAGELSEIIHYIASKERNPKTKNDLFTALNLVFSQGTNKAAKARFAALADTDKSIVNSSDSGALQFAQMIAFYNLNTDLQTACKTALSKSETDYKDDLLDAERRLAKDLKAKYNLLTADKKTNADGRDAVLAALKKARNNIQQGNREPFLAKELMQTINGILTKKPFFHKARTEGETLKYIRFLYEVEAKQKQINGVRQWFYTLVKAL